MCQFRITTVALLLLVACPALAAGTDGDGDGLSDFQEIHKYMTDPTLSDSDGDGIFDGDWHERREFTYTIRSVIKVMRPCNIAELNDDYQDARVLSETEDYVELEVIHYPFNNNADAIEGTRNWQDGGDTLKSYLAPGITTNWDGQMRLDLLTQLKADGIDVASLTDKEVVERVSRWAISRSRLLDKVFTTHYVHFPEGVPTVYHGLEDAVRREFERDCANYDWDIDKHFDHELLGRGMFYNKTRGSCTSSAVYLTTVLRAAGIPTRMVLAIPVVDPTDPDQLALVEQHVSHHEIRTTLLSDLRELDGYSAHTFNEVFVGGRWCRLNFTTLGQNIYGQGAMGLLTHVHTFNDLSEAGLAATWGVRYGKRVRDSTFEYSNPYRTTELSDRFGVHCQLANPPVEEPKTLLITAAYWFFSEDRPAWVGKDKFRQDDDGHVMVRVKASGRNMRFIYPKLDKRFQLVAEGQPPVAAQAKRGYWSHGTQNEAHHECYVHISAEELARMIPLVPYRIAPVDGDSEYTWEVGGDVTITKQPAPKNR